MDGSHEYNDGSVYSSQFAHIGINNFFFINLLKSITIYLLYYSKTLKIIFD